MDVEAAVLRDKKGAKPSPRHEVGRFPTPNCHIKKAPVSTNAVDHITWTNEEFFGINRIGNGRRFPHFQNI